MAVINACELPEDLLYDVELDVWAREEADGSLTLGMTDPAQTRAGKVVHVHVRGVGKRVMRGRSAATIESGKWVGPFPMPFAGEIVEANAALAREPNLINKDTYGAGWIVRVRPTGSDARERLLAGREAMERYGAKIRESGIFCVRCAD